MLLALYFARGSESKGILLSESTNQGPNPLVISIRNSFVVYLIRYVVHWILFENLSKNLKQSFHISDFRE